jgi:hypothetical protein
MTRKFRSWEAVGFKLLVTTVKLELEAEVYQPSEAHMRSVRKARVDSELGFVLIFYMRNIYVILLIANVKNCTYYHWTRC